MAANIRGPLRGAGCTASSKISKFLSGFLTLEKLDRHEESFTYSTNIIEHHYVSDIN